MWRFLFRPEVLFLFGTVQAIAPYAIWAKFGPHPVYEYPITYIPLVYWVGGYIAFWIGAKLIGKKSLPPVSVQLAGRGHRVISWAHLIVIAVIVQSVILSVAVYGGIPILSFLSGARVNVDVAARANSFIGQLALFLTSQFLLDAIILLLIITPIVGARRHRLLLIAAGLTVVAAGTFAGKRQAIAIAIVLVAVGSTIIFGHPLRPALQYLGFRRPRWTARVLMIALPAAFIAFLGIMASLRSGLESTGRQQLAAYLQVGLINFETQAGAAGYGPAKYLPLRMTRYFIPDRLADRIELIAGNEPPRAEPTAPAGFYGELHWNVGFRGAMLFAFLVGMIAKYFFVRARGSLWHLLVYSLMAWTLVTPYLYNHFLHANFLLFPSIAFAVLLRMIGLRRPGRRVMVAPPPPPRIHAAAPSTSSR